MLFTINIEPDRVEEARESLETLGISFNPHQDMIVLWDEATLDTIATPANAPTIIKILNDILREEGSELSLKELPEHLTLQELEDLLAFGHNSEEYILQFKDQNCLNRLRVEHPLLHQRLT